MVYRLNDLTQDQMHAIRESATKGKREDRACLHCHKIISMRIGQRFCSPAHRIAYAHAAAQLAYDKLVEEKARWLEERADLVHEVSELRHQVAHLKTLIR